MVDLIPVDHDPFADPSAPTWGLASALAGTTPPTAPAQPGYFGQIGQDISDFWRDPLGHMQRQATGVGEAFTGAARAGLQRQAELLSPETAAQPLLTVNRGTGEIGGRLPALAELATSGMAGPVPGGGAGMVLGAGPRITRGAGALDTPISDALKTADLGAQLRDMHLARGADALPLTGKGSTPPVVSPPPGVQSMDDFEGLANRYADLAQQGARGRDWYRDSGRAVLQAAGNPEAADRFAAALSGTSPQTDVAGNLTEAARAWNQAMGGDPTLAAGRFPATMGARVQQYLYGGAPVTGEKIGPFMAALGKEWNPDFDHAFVNDIWNMRALEYPPELGKVKDAPYYTGTPTLGQHNFARIVADRAADILGERTGLDWQPQQTQAAAWTGIKDKLEGPPPAGPGLQEAGVPYQGRLGDPGSIANFADALKARVAQQSWESAPGETTNHMPEFKGAADIDKQAYHQAIRSVLEDDQGRDLISQHLGLLNLPSIEGPGVFGGVVRPGSQAQSVAGMAPGGYMQGVDPASRDLLDTAEAVRGLLLRQDASAWHQPVFRPGLKPGDANLVDVNLGRTLTTSEAQAATEAMANASGSTFFSPIATPSGFRFMNVPDVSGIKNTDFHKYVNTALADERLPDSSPRLGFADGGYIENNWKDQPGGQSYLAAISGTGRPDVERRAAEVLANLGPRVSEVENQFQASHGWTPDPATRVWENNPTIEQYGGVSIPSPPRPWAQGGPGPAPGSRPPLLVPVDHDPFAGPMPITPQQRALLAAGGA
jgi:hypothetical protein